MIVFVVLLVGMFYTWQIMEQKKKVLTLCLLHTDTHVLLGKKKRGFGAGKWNGFGGKVEAGESADSRLGRELL